MSGTRLDFQPLGPRHDRAAFRCGQPVLDRYLQQQAGQDARRDVARVFVATSPGDVAIAGYYTLSSFAIALTDMPAALARRLPSYGEVPAALIGRLARDERWRGKGVGELLLADAIGRVLDAAERLAIHVVVVDAKDEAAAAFYRSFGFVPLALRPGRLLLPLATAASARSGPR